MQKSSFGYAHLTYLLIACLIMHTSCFISTLARRSSFYSLHSLSTPTFGFSAPLRLLTMTHRESHSQVHSSAFIGAGLAAGVCSPTKVPITFPTPLILRLLFRTYLYKIQSIRHMYPIIYSLYSFLFSAYPTVVNK
jgi:hypothetical protein